MIWTLVKRLDRVFTVLTIYNLLEQEVRTLVNGRQAPGQYDVRWDGRDRSGRRVNSGMYLYRLKTGSRSESRKMLLLR